ncbi:ATP-binding cassette sub-family F member 3-like [Ostrea edulis]|uniref:ATP-binding cassette sub-family F member 3-like n=1 Tax=Ostrea edulis TaxID=37623 RepID=UPI002094254A|nr:ATP-binding cassette sub-family F member 3-like [Ostrea edulis]
MADYETVLTQSFPNIDSEIVHYVNGMLEDGHDDFQTSEDLYDAIGGILQGTDDSKTDDEIKNICGNLHSLMSLTQNKDSATSVNKLLNAPVQLSSLHTSIENVKQSNSIWISKRDSNTLVDQKKLDKAEAQIKKKQERKSDNKIKLIVREEATACQQINKKDVKLDSSGTNRSYDIKIENFDIAFGEKQLISGASIHLVYGRRYGFVGRNGLGKTTLLKMISRGNLMIPSHISQLHVEQEVDGDNTIALESVLECDEERNSLLKEEKEIALRLSSSPTGSDNMLSTRLTEIYHQLEAIEADKAPARASIILAGLGFTPAMQKMPTKEFSGGWRMRLALARALFSQPDLLLLDEPTNMLDMKAIIWLENYLQTWKSTILVVSHDRSFLNSVATDILHLHNGAIDNYRGNYESFNKTREERQKSQQKEYEAQKEYRDHIQVFIDRFRYNANRASQVQSKLKLLEKLPELKPIEKESKVTLKFTDCEYLQQNVLQLDELDFYYTKEKPIFKNINLNTQSDSRICIVGENGAGKSTLLKILLGELDPVRGWRKANRNLCVGYFSQHHVDQLDMTLTSIELMAERYPGKPTELYRNRLGAFGVSGELATRPVSSLSGGQKSRVAFAVIDMLNPNFLILDEPTNHLDMETIEALGNAITKFQGGVVLVSHDERLVRMVCRELWVVKDGTVKSLDGGFDEYRNIVEKELAENGV